MHYPFSNFFITLANSCSIAGLEARFLLWQLKDPKKVLEYSGTRKRGAYLQNNKESLSFWSEVEGHILEGIKVGEDQTGDLISLIAYVDSLPPRKKWIMPILAGIHGQDFRNQLFTAMEDYAKERDNIRLDEKS